MAYGSGLQVLKGGVLTSENQFKAASRTNIINGSRGTIFQASNDDLYAMGNETGLQILKGGVIILTIPKVGL